MKCVYVCMYVWDTRPRPVPGCLLACFPSFLPKCVCVSMMCRPSSCSPRDDHGEPVDPGRAGARYTADPVAARGDEGVTV